MKRTIFGVAAALALAASAPCAQAQSFINVLTGGTSGVYYPLGVAIGKIYGDKIPNVKTQVQATKASVENLILLQQGRGELAFTLGDSLKAAWDGEEEAGFKTKLDKLRTIGAIYPNYIQIVATAESGIKTLADLKGKSLSVGAPKSGTELNSRAILAAAGMSYKDLGKVEYLPFAESVDLMKNRQLGATLQSAGLGVASLKDLSTSSPITVVSVPKETVDKIGLPFIAATIPANTYTGQDKDVPTAAVVNYLVTSSAVSDDLAYQMTKLGLRVVARARQCACGRQGDQARDGGQRQPGSAASRRDPLLQGKRADQVRSALIIGRHGRGKSAKRVFAQMSRPSTF
ncbi:TRAP transporter TAXI family solute receptor [Bradyrhizobium sp. LB7.1]